MSVKTLVIGAGGNVGRHLMKELDQNPGDLDIIYTSIFPEEVKNWTEAGRKAVLMNLDSIEDIRNAMKGMERVFLLTTYSADMLVWSYHVVDLAKEAGVKFIVHHGTYTSPNNELEMIPHFIWHRMIEAYIAQSGIAWANVHPNNIIDTAFNGYNFKEKKIFRNMWGKGAQGIIWASDIGAVEAAVLREGPEKHNGKDYYLSTEVINAEQVMEQMKEVTGETFTEIPVSAEDQKKDIENIPSLGFRYYLGYSAVYYMDTVRYNQQPKKLEVRDDCMTVLGRPGKSFKVGFKEYWEQN